MSISDADRQRLVRILGMLGSEHQGERDAAARQAEAFRRRLGLTWADLLALGSVAAPEPPAWAPPPRAAPDPPPEPPAPEPPNL